MSIRHLPELSHESVAINDILGRLERIENILAGVTPNCHSSSPDSILAATGAKDTVVAVTDTPTNINWPVRRIALQEAPTEVYSQSCLKLDNAIAMTSRSTVTDDSDDGETVCPTAIAGDSVRIDWIEALPEPVMVLNDRGDICFWSNAAEDWLGWTKSDVHGKAPQFLADEGLMAFHRLLTQVRQGIRVREACLPVLAASGLLLHAVISASMDASGHVVMILRPTLNPEANGRVSTESDDEPAAVRKLDLLGKMTAGLVHDFNNVLSAVGGSAQIILESAPAGAMRESAEVIQSATRFATDLTQRVLHVMTDTPVNPELLNLSDVVTDLERLIRVMANGVKCVITPAADLPAVRIDRTEIQQLILNLVANARDAMPRGGLLGIRTSVIEVHQPREGWPTHLPSGPFVCLTVIDTGKGIQESFRQKMFEAFSTTKSTHTGLGLSIIHDVIHRAGGHLEMDSVVDRGTVFRVFLPAVIDSENTKEIGRTVLLVDDDDSVRMMAKTILERVGFSVLEAVAGDDAWKLAKAISRPVDLLVTDIVLPGLNGRKLAERLRAMHSNTPVVFVSGYAQTDQHLPRGTAFVSKPFRASDLLNAVRKARATIDC